MRNNSFSRGLLCHRDLRRLYSASLWRGWGGVGDRRGGDEAGVGGDRRGGVGDRCGGGGAGVGVGDRCGGDGAGVELEIAVGMKSSRPPRRCDEMGNE